MATINLEKMHLSAIIGTNEHERTRRQNILLNIEFDYDSSRAQKSDNLHDAVDYFAMAEAIRNAVTESSYYLLERLADHLNAIILSYRGVTRARVAITKFGVVPETESVTLTIEELK